MEERAGGEWGKRELRLGCAASVAPAKGKEMEAAGEGEHGGARLEARRGAAAASAGGRSGGARWRRGVRGRRAGRRPGRKPCCGSGATRGAVRRGTEQGAARRHLCWGEAARRLVAVKGNAAAQASLAADGAELRRRRLAVAPGGGARGFVAEAWPAAPRRGVTVEGRRRCWARDAASCGGA